jgi:dTDP-4-dehydrorhamnose reductase
LSGQGSRPRILVTGRDGQVGFELVRALAPLGEIRAVDVGDVDLCDPDAIQDLVRGLRPSLIVNPAAYTAVDKAEIEADVARAVNAAAPGILAEEAARLGAPILHYSTDYVFDGAKREPYLEEDAPSPTGVYGRTKLEGEEAVRRSGARHVILRLAWVYGTRGHNFLLTMLRLGRERKSLRVVDDQIGSPTWCRLIAEASAVLCRDLLRGEGVPSGVYHLPAGGETSWHGFAQAIFDAAAAGGRGERPEIEAIPTSAYPTPARRPTYSVLSGKRLEAAAGIALPDWRVQLGLALAGASGLEERVA